ncbi:hypothetical protein [Frankia gtarii]|uniref:hypothetical protein n=1 Tax=Frankia gtarii TaxID=2950102 RepID=UPI0021BE8683|nr:hypothetical protein [Frankia gtarii]
MSKTTGAELMRPPLPATVVRGRIMAAITPRSDSTEGRRTRRSRFLYLAAVLVAVLMAGVLGMASPASASSQITPVNRSITFKGGTPVGGWMRLTLNSDGTYRYSGHLHVSGAPSYNDEVVVAVSAANGTTFTFSHTGRLHGTFESGSRDDDWNRSGYRHAIRDAWPALSRSWHSQSRATVNWDAAAAVNSVVSALRTAGAVVGTVIAIV